MKPCKLCGDLTAVVFNINFKPVPVCQRCALAITKQEVLSWKLDAENYTTVTNSPELENIKIVSSS